ncbi:sulfotransferase family 2 domain-containing protein [Cytophaga aurantiaca]|uniref:sulfotransferase family 2 domain-containing protein n=1 Tax=Cytophaga aurantiaca TaxID=29530 RepID=UPI00039E6E1F|nr:sulfotransferase family 2 domain-containing protein [Cytophaga aurantiaca]
MKSWKLFSSKKLVPVSELNIELISLHIPKTGGTSFRSLLNNNYGIENVAQFDINYKENKYKFKINGKEVAEPLFPKDTKVLHGHFEYLNLIELYPNLKNVPIVTWVRDPVKRVVSNYYYLLEILTQENKNKPLALSLINRLACTLEEFSARPHARNKMTRYLKGLDIHSAYFIGIIENYSEDVLKLSKMLNWKHQHQEAVNQTSNKKTSIEDSIIKIIEGYNELDVQLYKDITQLVK